MVADRDRVIDGLYRAAGSELPWTDALAVLSEYCGGRTGVIYRADAQLGLRYPLAMHGIDPELGARYNDQYRAIDPWRIALLRADPGRVHSIDTIMDKRGLAGNRYYREALDPTGIHHGLTVRLELDGGESLVVTLHRSRDDGPMEAEHLGRLTDLLSHISRASLLHHQLAIAGQAHAMVEAVLQTQRPAILLLDRESRPVYMNAAARQLVDERRVLCLTDGCLSSPAAQDAMRLASCMARALGSGDGQSTASVSGLVLGNSALSPPLRTLLVPISELRPSMSQPWVDVIDAAVLAIASDGTLDAACVPDHVRARYGMTPTESTVLEHFLECGDPGEVASRLGVRISTVRSHLKSLLARTGARRQSELLSLFVRDLAHQPGARAQRSVVFPNAPQGGRTRSRARPVARWWVRPWGD